MSVKVKVHEVIKKSYEGREYFQFMVSSPEGDNIPEEERVPFCSINGQNYHKVGDIVSLGFNRNKEFKITVRVL